MAVVKGIYRCGAFVTIAEELFCMFLAFCRRSFLQVAAEGDGYEGKQWIFMHYCMKYHYQPANKLWRVFLPKQMWRVFSLLIGHLHSSLWDCCDLSDCLKWSLYTRQRTSLYFFSKYLTIIELFWSNIVGWVIGEILVNVYIKSDSLFRDKIYTFLHYLTSWIQKWYSHVAEISH